MVEVLLLVTSLYIGTNVCTPAQVIGGDCGIEGSIHDGGVDLDGSVTLPGDDGDGTTDIGVDGGESGSDPNTVCENRVGQSYCWSITPPGETAIAPVTLADIAHFEPIIGAHTMQPNGWAVVGLPANFVSGASVHTVQGILLGAPASVRFTPVSWTWDYGDGNGAERAGGGETWGELEYREFAATPTSHVFQRKGRYTVALTINLRAEYRVGSGSWTSIAGTLRVEPSPLPVVVTSARTVLVDRDCGTYSAGPGC